MQHTSVLQWCTTAYTPGNAPTLHCSSSTVRSCMQKPKPHQDCCSVSASICRMQQFNKTQLYVYNTPAPIYSSHTHKLYTSYTNRVHQHPPQHMLLSIHTSIPTSDVRKQAEVIRTTTADSTVHYTPSNCLCNLQVCNFTMYCGTRSHQSPNHSCTQSKRTKTRCETDLKTQTSDLSAELALSLNPMFGTNTNTNKLKR